MPVQPTNLSIQDGRLHIEWEDGKRHVYDPAGLRQNCPCAGCDEIRAGTEPGDHLSPAGDEPIAIHAVRPVGNYAYNIAFSDGHSTGLFRLELLRELGSSVEDS